MSTQTSSTDAYSFPEVRVVEASAGSGKTYALAKRYVQLLLNPALKDEDIPIRQVLAITFTNKAAFEMKGRILEFLKAIAFNRLNEHEQENILKPIGVTPKDASARAFAIMETIVHHYNFFQVQTIDKFINALLSGCAFKIGLTANFKIKTNSEDYLNFSLDDLLDQAPSNKDIRRVFEQFLHNFLFIEGRTGFFPKQDMLGVIKSLFAKYNAFGLGFKEGPYLPEDIVKKKLRIVELMKEVRTKLTPDVHKTFEKGLDTFLQKAEKGFDIDAIKDSIAKESIPYKKSACASKELDYLWSELNGQLKELCEQEAFSIFNPYIQTFNLVLDGMLRAATKDDVLFLSELNKKAGELFDEDQVTVMELYYRLATRFRHYLIDEFQDTSRLQWKNLEKMAEEALSTGGTLFYVGDRKQAIYGFRGGEVQLFDNIKNSFDPFNVKTDLLNKNYRSLHEIVAFNNRIFSVENLKAMVRAKEEYEEKKRNRSVLFNEEDLKEIEDVFQTAQQSVREGYEGGYVNMEYVNIDNKEERDEYIREGVIDHLQDLKKRYAPKDIAVLARSNTQVEQLTNWLLEENIQVDSERTSNVKENGIVQELIAFLKFLQTPIDNLAFAEFLLGEAFPKMTGIKPQEIQDFLFSLRKEITGVRNTYIYAAFRKKYKKHWDTNFNEFFQNVGLYPLYELLVSVYERFGLLKHFSAYQGYLMHFLQIVKDNEQEYPDLGSFLEYFEELEGEELFVNVREGDAIRILTIHKAKGLEFPVVIMPFVGMDIQVGAQSTNQQNYILFENDGEMNLIRSKKNYLKYSDRLYKIYRGEYKKAFLSELNAIYVGLTRAKNELYGFIPKKVGAAFNYATFLVPEDAYSYGKKQTQALTSQEEVTANPTAAVGLKATDAVSKTAGKEKDHRKIPVSQYHDWISFLKDEFQEYDDVHLRVRRLEGEIMHYMLSLVDNLSKQKLEPLLEEIHKKASNQFPNSPELDKYIPRVKKLLKNKLLQQFFAPDKSEVHTELEVANKFGDLKRIDRLIVNKDQVLIIDYKSSADDEDKHKKQMKEYKEIVSGIYTKRKVLCFIIYLDDGHYEEIK